MSSPALDIASGPVAALDGSPPVAVLLKLEALVVLATGLAAFAYLGVSWWGRLLHIPAEWKGKRIFLHIRGARPGDNFCSCPDFATNTLGTCKHIEFTLARLERKRDNRAHLRAGHVPPHSEVYLQYGSAR